MIDLAPHAFKFLEEDNTAKVNKVVRKHPMLKPVFFTREISASLRNDCWPETQTPEKWLPPPFCAAAHFHPQYPHRECTKMQVGGVGHCYCGIVA